MPSDSCSQIVRSPPRLRCRDLALLLSLLCPPLFAGRC
uniref:Uncharacterized protein n=1 Tax=Arundo donax TaxID=35708 RepID=A0A0A9G2B8_ARUDO